VSGWSREISTFGSAFAPFLVVDDPWAPNTVNPFESILFVVVVGTLGRVDGLVQVEEFAKVREDTSTSTAPTLTSATLPVPTGAVTSLPPAARQVVKRRPWSTPAGGPPCRAGGSSAQLMRAPKNESGCGLGTRFRNEVSLVGYTAVNACRSWRWRRPFEACRPFPSLPRPWAPSHR
jgi:hypothetical protein